MFDPVTLLMVGGGIIAFREMNKKDYGILTPSRDERYRNVMEYCHDPAMLMQEAKLFYEHGLKAQAAMLKRRAEWRSRPQELKAAHEEVYQKALKSQNINGILEVAAAFEGWTATKKAATLRDRAQYLQQQAIQDAAKKAAEAVKAATEHANGAGTNIPRNEPEPPQTPQTIADDT